MLRLFIVDEQGRPRSECWYFKSRGSSIYVGPEKTGHALKLSFHDDDGSARDGRNSQYGLLKDYAAKELQFGAQLPPLARWKRPETPPEGLAQVASINFPTDFLNGAFSAFKSGRTRVAVPIAPPGRAIEVGLFYSRDEPASIRMALDTATGKCLGFFTLSNGENVAVAARVVSYDPALIRSASNDVRRHPLRGAPRADEVFECSGVLHHRYPGDGEPLFLSEFNGIRVKGTS
jgi:hypothetical protein